MKKRALTAILTLALAFGLTAPAGAFEAGAVDTPTSLGVSGTFSAVVDEDGTLWTWGNNHYGQLGNDNQGNVKNGSGNPEQNVPTPILEEVRSVAVGGFHGAAIKEDGTLWTWGCNDNGQVGQEQVNDKDVIWYWTFIIPHRIVTPYQSVPVQILKDVAAVSAGDYFTAAIQKDGALWMWGDNGCGQLGTAHKKDQRNTIGGACRKTPTLVMEDVAAVACGAFHTLILKTDGTLWVCGNNAYGQLGTGDTTDRDAPMQLMTDVAAISAGHGYSVALKTDGTLWTWGQNEFGQLGTGNILDKSEPTQVMENVARISTGDNHMAVIKADGTLWTWGFDQQNQLGTGQPLAEENQMRFETQPTQVMEDAVFVAAGTCTTLAAKIDGSLWTWGSDFGCHLGNGSAGDLEQPDGYEVQSVPALLAGGLTVKVPDALRGGPTARE